MAVPNTRWGPSQLAFEMGSLLRDDLDRRPFSAFVHFPLGLLGPHLEDADGIGALKSESSSKDAGTGIS